MLSSFRTSVIVRVLPALALWLGACAPDVTPDWPQDTVFVMDGLPLTSTEIDAYAAPLAEIGPSFTLPHRRRVALTEVLIPRARARALYPAERESALERLRAHQAALENGLEDSPEPVVGTWSTIGTPAWLALRTCAVGEWTEIFEGPGTVAQAKLIARDGDAVATRESFECLLLWEHYSEDFSNDPAVFGGELEVVAEDAETWRAVLPTSWLYELERTNR
jgi:hypothetical protein